MLRTLLPIVTLISAGVTSTPNLTLLLWCRIPGDGLTKLGLNLLQWGIRGLWQFIYLKVLVKLICDLQPVRASV